MVLKGSVRLMSIGCLALAIAAVLVPASAGDSAAIDIPYTKYVLDNGLTLIVHEDDKAPIVAVNVWYHVGSKNEKLGKTGFAHLFEHLMFNGSENYNDDYFKPFDRVGVTDMNGTTNFDRTNYFQNVPTTALDMALWMESDRMGHLLGAIDQAKLDEQRGVVQNEKRQGENQPYGQAFRLIFENTYPKGHPYSWSIIGSLEDLDAASLDDVHEWFKTYYGAANATLVVAGDVKAEDVKKRVEAYFGDIPSGPPLGRHQAWVAKRSGEHRKVLQDRVPQARIYKVWNVPEWGTDEVLYLSLAQDILTSGKNSRLYKRLVYEDQTATNVSGFVYDREIGSLFVLYVTAQPGQDLAGVEKAMDEEIARFLAEGPTPEEVERVRAQYLAGFIRGVERVGGFGGKSDILAQYQVFGSDPDLYKHELERARAATAKKLHDAARDWISDGVFALEVQPFPEHSTLEAQADRSKLPEPEGFPKVKFPAMQTTKLSNGLKLILAPRKAVPVVEFNLMLDAGYAADQLSAPGTASLAMNMLDEGTTHRSALEISQQLSMLGARIGSGSNLDMSVVSLSALKENLDESLEIYADVILNPAFAEQEFGRLKKQQLAAIGREKTTPFQMALRVMPKLMYGEGHAYSVPFTGSGTEEAVTALKISDLKKFHETWFTPSNATLVIVGDTTMDEIRPKLERLFKDWKAKKVPQKNIKQVKATERQVYLIDRPGSIQSVIFAGHVAPPKSDPDDIAIQAMNDVLGGSFTARINMNLREDKHWSYGARSILVEARGQRPFVVFAPVQTDKTKESIVEIQNEINGIISSEPPTDDEVSRVKDQNTLSLPGRWETNGAVMGSIAEMVRFGLADDFWDTYSGKVKSLTRSEITDIAKKVVQPDNMIWVVVGDLEKIEPGIRELGLGNLKHIDADGNKMAQGPGGSDPASVQP